MRACVLLSIVLLTLSAQAQTVLFTETFDGTPAFALNTADQGGVTNSLDNTWLINSAYAGGSGSVVCLGFPLPFTVPGTPAQPGGITNANGNYLHITSVAAQNSGVLSCCFLAADGLCASQASHFARMTTDVATGAEEISLSFWWLCAGGTNNYGEVYYSTNSGSSWNVINTPIAQYRNQGNWVQQSITLPAFSNQATLRFGFRFFNGTTLSAQDPAFAVDDVRITAAGAVPNSIATGALAGSAYCQGAQLSVPYTALGTYIGGNIFSAQLSDASGSFAAPTVIGTLASTVSGSISCTIPALAPPGTGYRIRVVSSDPVTVGSANAVDITITAAPYAGPDDQVTLCKNSGIYDLLQFMPGASTCGGWTGPGGAPFSGQLNTATDLGGVFTYTTNCPGGCPQDAATLTVVLLNPANAGNDVSAALCSNGTPPSLISYVNGGDLTGIFYYQGSTIPPDFSVPGTYALDYVVFGTAPCTNDTADFLFTVNAAANAGTSSSVTVCQNDPVTPLIDFLGGSPQTNGTWTGPTGQNVPSVFNPAVGPAGLYTHTVAGTPPCGQAQAFVAIVIDPCQGVGEATAAQPMRWLGQEGDAHNVEFDAQARSIDVVDARGRVVLTHAGPFAAGRQSLVMHGLSSGSYVLRVTMMDGFAALRIAHQAR
ncbi:MAG: hypothetical protein IPM46_05055 [Flavobacteriales bacterium]|nr:hypothetical protein [Flavobacteriales bacterium]